MKFEIETEGQNQFLVFSDETIGDRAFMGQLLTEESEDIVVGRIEKKELGFRILLPLGAAQDEWRNDRTTRNIIESLSGQNDALESLRTRCADAAEELFRKTLGMALDVPEQFSEEAGASIERACKDARAYILTTPLEISHEETKTGDAVGEGPSEQQGQSAGSSYTSKDGPRSIFHPDYDRCNANQQDNENQGPGNSVAGESGPETEG